MGPSRGLERLQGPVQQEEGEDIHHKADQYVSRQGYLLDEAFRRYRSKIWRLIRRIALHG